MPSTSSGLELAKRYFDQLFVRRDFSRFEEFCAPDCIFHDPVHGDLTLDEMKKVQPFYDAAFAMRDVRCEEIIDAGETQVLRFSMKARFQGAFAGFQPTFREGNVNGIAICRFENGKLAEQWANWNLFGLLQQVGAFEAATQPGAEEVRDYPEADYGETEVITTQPFE